MSSRQDTKLDVRLFRLSDAMLSWVPPSIKDHWLATRDKIRAADGEVDFFFTPNGRTMAVVRPDRNIPIDYPELQKQFDELRQTGSITSVPVVWVT